jgi:hypothetical protein
MAPSCSPMDVTTDTVRPTVQLEERSAARLRLLAYVHLRNIYGSTGAGRTARQIVEQLAERDDVLLHILADETDHRVILPKVQRPWIEYSYHTFQADTSRQQAKWMLLDRPRAEDFWPQAQIVYCTAESYVPVERARLVVTAHDAAYFESGAHAQNAGFLKTRLKWKLLFKRLARRVDLFHTVSQFSAERLGQPHVRPCSRRSPFPQERRTHPRSGTETLEAFS